MKTEIITTPAVTEERIVMVPKTETVVVKPAVQEVTLTLNAKEALHLLNILGARNNMDSRLGATGDAGFELDAHKALRNYLERADPSALRERWNSAALKREEDRNEAFRAAGGYK